MNMKKTSMLYSQAIIGVAINSANLFNIGFMLMALRLPAHSFAEITSILATTFLFSVSQTSARNQLLLVRKETGNLRTSIGRTIATLLPIAVAEAAVIAGSSSVIAAFLHFDSALPFIIISGCAFTYVINGIMQGIFASEEHSTHHAVSLVTESISRIPISLLFFQNGYHSTDAAWIMLLASSSALLVNMAIVPKTLRTYIRSFSLSFSSKKDFTVAACILASTIMVGLALKIDILWAKHVLGSEQAGVYGIMNFIASVLFLNSSSVSRASLSFIRKTNFSRMVLTSYAVIFGICAVCVGGFYLAALPLLTFISPDASQIDHLALLILFVATTAYCFINFSFQFLSVLHRNIHLALTGSLAVIQVASLVLFGHDMVSIAKVQAVIMVVFGIIFTIGLLHKKHTPAKIEHISRHHITI